MKLFRKRKSGFARTKQIPHKRHPATYNRLDNDEIEYITFTHHNPAKLDGKEIETIELDDNIEISKRKSGEKSFAFPKVYIGKRSALGKEDNKLNLSENDKIKVKNLFETLPRERIVYTSNSNKQKRK